MQNGYITLIPKKDYETLITIIMNSIKMILHEATNHWGSETIDLIKTLRTQDRNQLWMIILSVPSCPVVSTLISSYCCSFQFKLVATQIHHNARYVRYIIQIKNSIPQLGIEPASPVKPEIIECAKITYGPNLKVNV